MHIVIEVRFNVAPWPSVDPPSCHWRQPPASRPAQLWSRWSCGSPLASCWTSACRWQSGGLTRPTGAGAAGWPLQAEQRFPKRSFKESVFHRAAAVNCGPRKVAGRRGCLYFSYTVFYQMRTPLLYESICARLLPPGRLNLFAPSWAPVLAWAPLQHPWCFMPVSKFPKEKIVCSLLFSPLWHHWGQQKLSMWINHTKSDCGIDSATFFNVRWRMFTMQNFAVARSVFIFTSSNLNVATAWAMPRGTGTELLSNF